MDITLVFKKMGQFKPKKNKCSVINGFITYNSIKSKVNDV